MVESLRTEIKESSEKAAKKYLNEVVGRVNLSGVEVQKRFITGKVAESIAEYATKSDVDLIVIATHGRSGISRWALGSVADRVFSVLPVYRY